MPNPGKDTIPTLDFLAEIEKKYGQKINGDLDETRLQGQSFCQILTNIELKKIR